MAEKGARAKLETVAMRMYAEGESLTDIEAALDVSRQTLSTWKARTKAPGDDKDDWDRAREQKRSNVQRLRHLFDRELTALENTNAGQIGAGSLDAITKLGTLVQRWEAAETGPGYDKAKVFLETLEFIAGWLREHDPAGLKTLAENFDSLTLAFKLECMSGTTDA